MKALTAALLLATLQCSWALTPTDCNATKPLAEKALDLINKWRRDGYLFQLLRVADAHLDGAEYATVYYLVLDVKETDCSVLTRKHWEDCDPDLTKRPSVDVIGQCKVIATIYSDEYQTLRLNDFNCTTSSVSSALANTKDSPVLFDFIEDTEPFRKSADKALEEYRSENEAYASFRVDRVERVTRVRGGERTNYYVDFSVRNCSRSHFHRHPDFGFCRADLSFDVGASDLENPEDVIISCEVFNFEEHGNISGFRPHLGKTPLGADGSRDHHHPHKPHKFGCPPPQEGEDFSDGPPSQGGTPPLSPPSGPRCRLRPFGTNETHRFPHHRNFSEHHHHGPPPHGPPPHGHHPHGPPPHGHHPHGPPPHGHHPHGPPPHGHHPHGPPPHGPPPHGPPPHGHPPHGPPPHGHPPHGPPPHGHHPHDHGPCDPPSHREGPQDLHGHGPPPKHPGKRGPGKGYFPFHWRRIGSVYQLPPLQKGEVLPLPEANFPSFSLLNHTHPLKPEIQPFPQIASERCPGEFNGEFAQLSKFFPSTFPK